MNLLETIMAAQGGGALGGLAQGFGLQNDQAASALKALLPALSSGLKKNTSSPSGMAGLLGALESGSHHEYLDKPSRLGTPEAIADGNGILGHLLGSKDVSRRVASQAADQTGLSGDLLKKMLPVVASMAMGALAKNTSQRGIQSRAMATQPGGGVLEMLSPMLDADGDGSVADDLLGMAGKFFSR